VSAASATDFLTEYVEGWAQLLATEADPAQGFAWDPAGDYADGQTGIFLHDVPTAPDRVVVLNPTPFDAHPTLTDSRVDLQIRFRAGTDIREVWAMRNASRDVLAGRFPCRLPTGIYVSVLDFSYGTSLGREPGTRRAEWSDVYRTRVSEPRT
jgi:hypothetical protein